MATGLIMGICRGAKAGRQRYARSWCNLEPMVRAITFLGYSVNGIERRGHPKTVADRSLLGRHRSTRAAQNDIKVGSDVFFMAATVWKGQLSFGLSDEVAES